MYEVFIFEMAHMMRSEYSIENLTQTIITGLIEYAKFQLFIESCNLLMVSIHGMRTTKQCNELKYRYKLTWFATIM